MPFVQPPPATIGEGIKKELGMPYAAATKDSRLTDPLSCICFLIAVGFIVAVSVWSFFYGSPSRLSHGFDYQGNLCGIDVSNEYSYWCAKGFWTGAFPQELYYDGPICVSECPSSNTVDLACPTQEYVDFEETADIPAPTGHYLAGLTIQKERSFTVTQAVVTQRSYPTEAWGGKFCVPAHGDNNGLRSGLIRNRLSGRHLLSTAIGSFISAWPLVLLIWVLTLILGYIWLWAMGKYAGLVIFFSSAFTSILLIIAGMYFTMSMFVNRDDTDSRYQKTNPFYRNLAVDVAQEFSTAVGIILLVLGILIACFAYFSVKAIDRSIGLVWATAECYRTHAWDFKLLPVIQSAATCGVVFGLMFFLQWVLTFGFIDKQLVVVEDVEVEGLLAAFRREWWMDYIIAFYIFFIWWALEFTVSLFDYCVSYCTDEWFKAKKEEEQYELADANAQRVMVRVQAAGIPVGVEERQATVVKQDGGDNLLIPLYGRNNQAQASRSTLKSVSGLICPVCRGLTEGLTYHLGTLAKGSLIIAIFRIPRLIAKLIMSFLLALTPSSDDRDMQSSSGASGLWCGMIGTAIDLFVGKYNRIAYTHTCITGFTFFFDACNESAQLILRSAGVVAFLQGACTMFEGVHILFNTVLLTWLTNLIVEGFWLFTDPTSMFYVPNPGFVTVMMAALIAITSYAFSGLFVHTADSLLYCFALYRDLGKLDATWLPSSLGSLFGAEKGAAPGQGIQATYSPGTFALQGATMVAPVSTFMPDTRAARTSIMNTFNTMTGRNAAE